MQIKSKVRLAKMSQYINIIYNYNILERRLAQMDLSTMFLPFTHIAHNFPYKPTK